MLAATLRLALRDFLYLIRSPVTIVWAFVMPVVFFSFIGKITGRSAPGPATRDPIAVFVPADAGFLADACLRHLNAVGYNVTRVSSEAELARFSRRLRVPSGFTAAALAGKPQKLDFERGGEPGLGGDYDKVRLSRATYGLLAEFIAVRRQGAAPNATSLLAIAETPRSLTIETQPAGRRRFAPSGYQQSVPGTLVMFVLTVMLTSGGVSIVAERRLGILRRLASCPLGRGWILTAKWCSRFGLAAIQTAVGAVTGTLLFSIDWGTSLPAVALLLAAYCALCCSLGLWVGSLARSEGQASAAGVIAGNLLAALGGCWWPAEISPQWMQKISIVLPTGTAMDGLHRLMSFGAPAAEILPHTAALLILALAAGWLAARSFHFQ